MARYGHCEIKYNKPHSWYPLQKGPGKKGTLAVPPGSSIAAQYRTSHRERVGASPRQVPDIA
eukprot:436493-Rhodomonas_salina.1